MERLFKRSGFWNPFSFKQCTHAAFLQDVPQVGRQPVANIHHGVHPPGFAQEDPLLHARHEIEMPTVDAATERTGHKYAVAGFCAGTQQRGTGRKHARSENVQFQARPLRQVTANDGCAKALAERGHSFVDFFQDLEILLRRGNHIDQQPLRLRTHRGNIAQHAPRRLVADPLRLFRRLEMDALDDGIGGENLIGSRSGKFAHGAVVAGTDPQVGVDSEPRRQAPDSFMFTDFPYLLHARMIHFLAR